MIKIESQFDYTRTELVKPWWTIEKNNQCRFLFHNVTPTKSPPCARLHSCSWFDFQGQNRKVNLSFEFLSFSAFQQSTFPLQHSMSNIRAHSYLILWLDSQQDPPKRLLDLYTLHFGLKNLPNPILESWSSLWAVLYLVLVLLYLALI